jgi:hypothetical protein
MNALCLIHTGGWCRCSVLLCWALMMRPLKHVLDSFKEAKGVDSDTDLEAADLKELTEKFKAWLKKKWVLTSRRIL